MLNDRLLDLIAAKPGITTPELRAAFPKTKSAKIYRALHRLRQAGAVDMYEYRRYRLPAKASTVAPRTMASSSFIRPPSLERLMAGR